MPSSQIEVQEYSSKEFCIRILKDRHAACVGVVVYAVFGEAYIYIIFFSRPDSNEAPKKVHAYFLATRFFGKRSCHAPFSRSSSIVDQRSWYKGSAD